MTDNEVERLIDRLREARRTEAFIKKACQEIEDALGDAGIECTHHITHTAWRRVRAEGKSESEGAST